MILRAEGTLRSGELITLNFDYIFSYKKVIIINLKKEQKLL